VIPASREKVFAALLDADALTAWLPPAGMTGRFDHFEARPGGTYRLILMYEHLSVGRGKTSVASDIVEARFVEIVPGVRLVQAVDFVSDDPAYAGTMTVTWELTPVGGATRVEIRADNVPAGISAEDHAVGLTSSLANLAGYLERLRRDCAIACTDTRGRPTVADRSAHCGDDARWAALVVDASQH
jgi:uncharacterized protein YndB with AHSA1/START domain